ncbi:MAG: YihY/virulence factor BrkB family protein [Lentimicrobiaceae bacterium]|nr:YihY/virulence factor BrkB family protein [Lentimicrobiaceae bacterium]
MNIFKKWVIALQKLVIVFGESKVVSFVINTSKKMVIPGFDRIPLYDVTVFFIRGLQKGSLTTRAASLSFTFFLALFPAIIFFFTIIPYIPVVSFQETLLNLLKEVIPGNAFDAVKATVEDIILRQRGGLLSVGFILALYFSTSGVNSIITEFNNTYHTIETRNWFITRLISIFLVVLISTLIIIAIVLITTGAFLLNFLEEKQILTNSFTLVMLELGRWVVVIALIFFSISFLYFFAPAKRTKFRLFSAGSTLATLLSLATTLGFNYYVSNFSKYNTLYGSIGTLIVVLLWINFNAIVLLIGFELNASILNAKKNKNH